MGKQLTADDPVLESYLLAAIEQAQARPPYGSGRNLTPSPAADTGTVDLTFASAADGDVELPDASSITSVTVDGDPVTSFRPKVRDGFVVRITTSPSATVVVTGRFGMRPAPQTLVEAVYVLAARSYYERNAQYADQVVVGEGEAASTYFRQLPAKVKLAFSTYAIKPVTDIAVL